MKSSAAKKDHAAKKSAAKKSPLRTEQKNYFVYILEMENGALYTGYTDDVAARYLKHCSGKGAKFTRAFKPLRIAACWRTGGEKGIAMKVEALIKSLSRQEKERLLKRPSALQKLFIERRDLSTAIVPFAKREISRIEKAHRLTVPQKP
jgi:putative endonuclease